MPQADHFKQLIGPLDMLALVPPVAEDAVANHDRCQHVFERRELRQQVIELKDHAEVLISEHIAVARNEMIDASASKMDFAGVWRVERAEEMQQRALAAPALPDHRHNATRANLKLDPLQDWHY